MGRAAELHLQRKRQHHPEGAEGGDNGEGMYCGSAPHRCCGIPNEQQVELDAREGGR